MTILCIMHCKHNIQHILSFHHFQLNYIFEQHRIGIRVNAVNFDGLFPAASTLHDFFKFIIQFLLCCFIFHQSSGNFLCFWFQTFSKVFSWCMSLVLSHTWSHVYIHLSLFGCILLVECLKRKSIAEQQYVMIS